jgi:hypothetical protein
MLDQNFCEFLEYEITKALSNSKDERIKGFWCDGVLLPDSESEYSKKSVNDKRQVVMTTFTGQTGQDKYELTLRFGKKALSRYSRDLSLEECVPNPEDNNWFEIDPTNKKMVLQFD